jgi:hypothetical protein
MPSPSDYEWADAEGLDGWSEAELQAMYAERFGAPDAGAARRQARNARLRTRRMALLRELEQIAGERPAPTDRVDGWLPPGLAEQLCSSGVLLLGELQQRIARGGRWWRGLRAIGATKAKHLERYVDALLGPTASALAWPVGAELQALSGRFGRNGAQGVVCNIEASDDREAIRAWVAARAGSPATAKQYEREAERFLLWCALERGKALSDATVEDCRAYMDFLAEIPDRWIGRRKAARLAPGWAPFHGQLTAESRQRAIDVVHSAFAWLQRVNYLAGNPWAAVARRVGEDLNKRRQVDGGSRAFTHESWAVLLAHLERGCRRSRRAP